MAKMCLTFDFDGESMLYYRNEVTDGPAVFDLGLHRFGPLVGIQRLLNMADELDIPMSIYVPGRIVEKYPDRLKEIRDRGHELALHGYDHESWPDLSEEREAAILDKSMERMATIVDGPFGFRSPAWALNRWSLDLLIDRNILYDSSLMHMEQPYLVKTPSGRTIPEFPVHWTLDDWPYYGYVPWMGNQTAPVAPSELMNLWREEVKASLAYGGTPVLTGHPQISGRAGRIMALTDFIREFQRQGVEFVTVKSLLSELEGVPTIDFINM